MVGYFTIIGDIQTEIAIHKTRLDLMSRWVSTVSERTNEIPSRLAGIEAGLRDMNKRFDRIDSRLDWLQRKQNEHRSPPHEQR